MWDNRFFGDSAHPLVEHRQAPDAISLFQCYRQPSSPMAHSRHTQPCGNHKTVPGPRIQRPYSSGLSDLTLWEESVSDSSKNPHAALPPMHPRLPAEELPRPLLDTFWRYTPGVGLFPALQAQATTRFPLLPPFSRMTRSRER